MVVVERTCRLLLQRRSVKNQKRDLQNIFEENTSCLLPADDPSRVAHLYTPALHPFRYHTTLLALLSRLRSVLVTLLGLHHHPEGSYTLDELTLLTRSSMSTQRSTILEVLGKENLRYLLLLYASILAKMHWGNDLTVKLQNCFHLEWTRGR